MKTPKNVTRAIKNYGEQTCRTAYDLNRRVGEGANSISHQLSGLNTTRQADAAINAGCWLVDEAEYVRFYGDSEINNSRAASAFDAYRDASGSF
jgi:hypothetical protein